MPQFTMERSVVFNCSDMDSYIVCASYAGVSGMLLCRTDGNPSPTLNVTTDGVSDTSNVNFGTGSDITFTSVTSGNAGRYICNASSDIGFATREFRFYVGGQLLFVSSIIAVNQRCLHSTIVVQCERNHFDTVHKYMYLHTYHFMFVQS